MSFQLVKMRLWLLQVMKGYLLNGTRLWLVMMLRIIWSNSLLIGIHSILKLAQTMVPRSLLDRRIFLKQTNKAPKTILNQVTGWVQWEHGASFLSRSTFCRAQSRIHLRTILLYVVRKSDFELYKSRTNFHSFLYNLEEIIYTVSLYNKIWVWISEERSKVL